MRKLIRPTYPAQFSIALIVLIFVISSMLSYMIFTIPFHAFNENKQIYLGMFLVGMAVVIMLLIIWEEFLFPIKVKEINGGMVFRNHRTKLKMQLLIWCTIPAIFIFIYLEFEVNLIRFLFFAAICIVTPLIEKITSGINNYNDFLKLTDEKIEYKDNEKEGSFVTKDIQNISIIKEEGYIKELKLTFKNNTFVNIHLHEMELDAFYDSINNYIHSHYSHLLIEANSKA